VSLIIRSAITVILFSSFITLWIWAWRRENGERFAAAANQPLADDAPTPEATESIRP
jgi:cbb3-type cytochrome oxidase subunit 3